MINQFSIYGGSGGRSIHKPRAANENRVTIEIHSPFYKEDGPHIFTTIKGFLSKELQYEAKGNYKDIFNVVDLNSVPINFLTDEVQRNIANYGYLTKKTYTNSESPAISFEFRCLANDNWSSYDTRTEKGVSTNIVSNPIKIANYLIGMTTPHVNIDAVLLQDRVVAGAQNTMPGTEAFAGMGTNSIAGTAALALNSLTSRKPPVCRLKIGNIFEKDQMVLKNVSVTISKEYYAEGVPLYADFSVMFESLYSSVSISDGADTDEATNELNNKERIFGTGFNKKDGRDTRIQFEGVGYENQDLSRVQSGLTSQGSQPQ